MEAAPRRPATGLAVSLALYFALRALILISNFDEVAMPQYELFPMGTIPLLLEVDGALPIARVYDNAAGQILTGLLAAPSYALFGPTYLALKLVPLLLGAVALAALWWTLRECVGERLANFAGVLFAVAPTTLLKYSLMASGNHFETIAFTSLALAAWVRATRADASRASLATFGLACGFALFVFLGALTPVALLLLALWGVRGARQLLRDLPWLGAGLALGIAPLVALNWIAGARGLEFLGAKFASSESGFDAARTFARIEEFLFERLPQSTQFRDFGPLSGSAARTLFALAFVAAYLVLLAPAARAAWAMARRALGSRSIPAPAPREALAAILCAYLPLTALAFGLSSLKITPRGPPMDAEGFRYFNTHLLLAIAALALGAQRLLERGRWGARALLALALVPCANNLALVDWRFEHVNVGAHYDGFKLRQVATQLLSPRNGFDAEQVTRMIESHPPEQRTWIYQGVGRALAAQRYFAARGGALEIWSALEAYPAQRRVEIARGFGTFFRHLSRVRSELDPRFFECASDSREPDDALRAALVAGLAQDWEVPMARELERDVSESVRLLAALPEQHRAALAHGIGSVCAQMSLRGLAIDRELVARVAAELPAELVTSFNQGFGAGLAEAVRPAHDAEDPARWLGERAERATIAASRERRARELARPLSDA